MATTCRSISSPPSACRSRGCSMSRSGIARWCTRSRRRSRPPISGLTPSTEGQVLRAAIPELNEERRREIVKVAHKYAEGARVAVRHVRRDGLDLLKKLEKDHEISEDEHDRQTGEVQKVTDSDDCRGREIARRQGKGDHDGVSDADTKDKGSGAAGCGGRRL